MLHLHRTIHLIRDCNCRSGAALNPATPVSALEWIIEYLDFVLIMSVNPGFGGQKFIQSALRKTADLRKWIQSKNLSTLIEIDGGVNESTISRIADAGVDVFVAGSAIFKSLDYLNTISAFRHLIDDYPVDYNEVIDAIPS